jgi:TPR repeat protein
MYYSGEGVPEDYVLGYAWLNLAAAQGGEVSREGKDNFWTLMTPDQIARAQELSTTLLDRIN